VKIAAAAYPLEWHNRWNDFVGKLRIWVRTATEQGAELLVFPEYGAMELASLAEEDNTRDIARSVAAVTARLGDVDDLHASLAREFGAFICAASAPVAREDGTQVNRARIFAPDGSRGHQDKLIPTRGEGEDFGISPGGGLTVFDTALGRIGIVIAGDAEAATISRSLVAAGAEVVLLPGGARQLQGYWRQRVAAMARALEGRCAVVHSVTVGDADWLAVANRNVGEAAIYGPFEAGFPDDGLVAIGKLNVAGWVHGEVSLDALRRARSEAAAPGPVPGTAQDDGLSEVAILPLGSAAEPDPQAGG
jgi:predicted amidohydrolase